ncbi:MAG: DUF3842 family protein [Bacillota bacterium]
MKVAVVDGQGGGIGKHITEKIRRHFGEEIEIIALGTNAVATSLMLKAGANEGATGENAILRNVTEVDVITGSIAVVIANSMLGELTPAMALSISASKARKLLLPMLQTQVKIIGVVAEPLPHLVNLLIEELKLIKEASFHVRS